jgi:hypothetical protein
MFLALLNGISAELVKGQIRRMNGMKGLQLCEKCVLSLQHLWQQRIESAVELIVKLDQLLDLLFRDHAWSARRRSAALR